MSGSGSCLRSYVTFSNILDINFTFVVTSCICVRLHIMMRYKLFRDIFLMKKNLNFLIEYFCWEKIVKFHQILGVVLLQNSFRIRSCPDPEWFFPGSGSTPLAIMIIFSGLCRLSSTRRRICWTLPRWGWGRWTSAPPLPATPPLSSAPRRFTGGHPASKRLMQRFTILPDV